MKNGGRKKEPWRSLRLQKTTGLRKWRHRNSRILMSFGRLMHRFSNPNPPGPSHFCASEDRNWHVATIAICQISFIEVLSWDSQFPGPPLWHVRQGTILAFYHPCCLSTNVYPEMAVRRQWFEMRICLMPKFEDKPHKLSNEISQAPLVFWWAWMSCMHLDHPQQSF